MDAFDKARHIRDFAKQFPAHALHPDVQRLGKGVQTSQFVTVVRRVVYRDSRHQHADLGSAARVLERETQQHTKAVEAFKENKKKISESRIFAKAATSLVLSQAEEESSCVLAIGDDFFDPLMLRPSSIRKPREAPGTKQLVQAGDMLLLPLRSYIEEQPLVAILLSGAARKLNFQEQIETMGLERFLQDFKVWQKSSLRRFMLPLPLEFDVDASVLSDIISKMLDGDCLPGRPGVFRSSQPEHDAVLAFCKDVGFMEYSGTG